MGIEIARPSDLRVEVQISICRHKREAIENIERKPRFSKYQESCLAAASERDISVRRGDVGKVGECAAPTPAPI
jgi:hypothetical protein